MTNNTTLHLLYTLLLISLASAQSDSNDQPLLFCNPNVNDRPTNDSITVITGPVIGKVTNSTARILLEFDTNGTYTVNITDPDGVQFSVEKNVTACRPVVFAFENLTNNTKYTVNLTNSAINMTESSFTTLSGVSGKLNFATFSCNDRIVLSGISEEANLWEDLSRRIDNNEIQYLIQTGDQVYMDDTTGKNDSSKPYYKAIAALNETDREDWNSTLRDKILEWLRDEYRQVWGLPYIRKTMARIPSLMIIDDHQVRDDWGYLEGDYDENTTDYYYGQLARIVYYEYERQLREDIDFGNFSNMTAEYYYETLNDIGFFFLDYRGVRTWNRPYSNLGTSQLGSNQTDLLRSVLEPDVGAFANLTNFFLVSPLSVVFLVEALVRIGYYSNNDAQESWSYKYGDEQAQLLDMLRTWKRDMPGRDVTILDGDVHMGGYTDITYDDDFALLQFTTSSIASSAPDDATFLAFDLIKEVENLKDPWSFEHYDWTNKFNYGIVLVKPEDGGTSVECFLVKADDSDEPEIVGPESDSSDITDYSESEWEDVIARYS